MISVKQLFLEQHHRFFLWVPVGIGIGSGLYFSLPHNYSMALLIALAIICIIKSYFLRFSLLKHIPLLIIAICVGYGASAIRTENMKTSPLAFPVYYTEVTGKIERTYIIQHKRHIILEISSVKKLKNKILPKKIHLTTHNSMSLKENDSIRCKANLMPLLPRPLPGSYDFTRHAFFQQIGAKGYVVSDIELLYTHNSHNKFFDFSALRHTFHQRILRVLPGTEGAIASALLTGERSAIAEDVNQAMRVSGLYHILSISGLHMVMVTSCLFYALRALIACFPFIALRFSSKKIAAFFAILGGFFYLLLADAPIPAQRAFIVSSFFLGAILINRNPHPMRSIAYGAACILLFQPESVMTPSLHMSFAATIALIAWYENSQIFTKKVNIHYSFLKIFINHVILLISSSAIASLATLPFTLYHFHNYTLYGVFSNLLAVPLSNFWIMPLGIGSLFLMNLHLEALFLVPMGYGIEFLSKIAYFFANLPYATGSFSKVSMESLLLISIGLLWIVIWQGRIRWFGGVALLASICFFKSNPDIIISSKGTMWGVINEEGDLWVSSVSKREGAYEKKLWRNYVGKNNTQSMPNFVSCPEKGICFIQKYKKSIAIFSSEIFTQEDCDYNDVIINLKSSPMCCYNHTRVIQKRELKKYGTHFLTIQKNGVIKIEKSEEGKKLWVSPKNY